MLPWIKEHKIISTFLVTLCIFVLLILLIPIYKILTKEIRSSVNRQADYISQCQAVPMGKKACGGPEEYIVYSTKNTDSSRLKTLISTRDVIYAIVTTSLGSIVGGGMSNCSIERPPSSFELVNGECLGQYPHL